jgi:hypothetical protein
MRVIRLHAQQPRNQTANRERCVTAEPCVQDGNCKRNQNCKPERETQKGNAAGRQRTRERQVYEAEVPAATGRQPRESGMGKAGKA